MIEFPSRPDEWGEDWWEDALAQYAPRLVAMLRACGCEDQAMIEDVIVATWSRVWCSRRCVCSRRSFEILLVKIAVQELLRWNGP